MVHDTPPTLLALTDGLCHLIVSGDDSELHYAARGDATREIKVVPVDAPCIAAVVVVVMLVMRCGRAGVLDAAEGSGGGAAQREQGQQIVGGCATSRASATAARSTTRDEVLRKMDRTSKNSIAG